VASTVRRAELALARRASGVGIISEGFRDYFEQGGVASERITRLRMWTLGAEPTESVEASRRRLGWAPDDFVCLHGGNMGQKQALDNLLETAARLRGNGVHLVLAGDGNDRPRLENRAREMGLENLSFAPVQPWGQYESMLRAADLLIVNQRASVSDMSLPSKLTSYFVTGRPVVAAVAARSETALEVEAAEAGLIVAPEDPEALAEGIRSLRRSEDVRRAHGERGRAYADRYLRAERALPEYEQFVRGLARGRPR
jgi:glycosyltransferase involved in cell wall biosynthesis